MNTLINDNLPQLCSEVGLTCESCTAETASQLAAVCKGLRGKAVSQLFVQIYTNSACAPMHKRFVAHYRAASTVPVAMVPCAMEEPLPARREVTFARPRIMAAVA